MADTAVFFGTIPFLFSGSIDNFGDAFFESMSGFTTTGATIISRYRINATRNTILEKSYPMAWRYRHNIYFPLGTSCFKSINIQLASAEFSGQPTDKIHPRIIDAAKRLLLFIFISVTLSEIHFTLIIGGMPALMQYAILCQHSLQEVFPQEMKDSPFSPLHLLWQLLQYSCLLPE